MTAPFNYSVETALIEGRDQFKSITIYSSVDLYAVAKLLDLRDP